MRVYEDGVVGGVRQGRESMTDLLSTNEVYRDMAMQYAISLGLPMKAHAYLSLVS